MKYFLIAGEPSGDLHGAELMRNIKTQDQDAEFCFLGGDLMFKESTNRVMHYERMNFMGILEVIKKIKTIKENFAICKNELLQFKPNVVILIDYPGFNLKMAQFAKENGIRTAYYISPKIWAWKEWRIKSIKQFIDKMYCILPFEKEFYDKHNFKVELIGNPLADIINRFRANQPVDAVNPFQEEDKPVVALLSGSRYQELNKCLPLMVDVASRFKDFTFVIAGAPSIDAAYYQKFIDGSNIKIVYNQTYSLLSYSYAAVVVSGTATLETAIFGVPQVAIYKTSYLTYYVARLLYKLNFVTLPNLILNDEVIKEVLQFDMKNRTINELSSILYDDEYRKKMQENYQLISQKLGSNAAQNAAVNLHQWLKG